MTTKTRTATLLLLLAASCCALLHNATCMCAGWEHSCVISGFGDVVCWGAATIGQLGYGTNLQYLSPLAALAANSGGVQVTQNNTVRVLKIACGWYVTMALLANGEARGWGRNFDGQLGLGHDLDVGDDELPWQTPGGPVTLSGSVREVSCGAYHCCAVMDVPNLGAVACWGSAWSGKLGYGNRNGVGDDEIVASAGFVNVGGTGNAVAIFCGGSHTLALMNDGALRGWGQNGNGQLGLNHTSIIGDDEFPSTQPDIASGLGGGNVVEWVSAGGSHTCVVSSAGQGKCWGYGHRGRLGTGNFFDVIDPTSIGALDFGVGEIVVQLEAFLSHTCAMLATGNVKCFGPAANGCLGCGWACPDRLAPNESVALSGHVSRVSVGCSASHTLAVHPGGEFQAWGLGESGQLGYNDSETVGDFERPASVGNVNFPDGVHCAVSSRASVASHTATRATATLAANSQSGITRTPRSRSDTLTATVAWYASSTAAEPEPEPVASSSSDAAGGGGSVVATVVLVGVGAVAVLVVVVAGGAVGAFVVLRRRRRRSGGEVVEMSPSSSSGLEYANFGGAVDAAAQCANVRSQPL